MRSHDEHRYPHLAPSPVHPDANAVEERQVDAMPHFAKEIRHLLEVVAQPAAELLAEVP
jgi:hypothetical protein